jgi:hypothetical protein
VNSEYSYASWNRVRSRLNWKKLASVTACYGTVHYVDKSVEINHKLEKKEKVLCKVINL